MLNRMINSWPWDKWCTLEWWCSQGFDTQICNNWIGSIGANFETTVKRSNSTPHMPNDSTYDLTTKARQKVMCKNKQLDKGAGWITWKCLDPLNYVASVAFWKLGTWVQTCTWNFQGRTVPSWTLDLSHTRDCLSWAVTSQVHMVSTSIPLICCANLRWKRNMQGQFRYIYWPTWKNRKAGIYCDYTGWLRCLARGIYSLKLHLLLLWTGHMLCRSWTQMVRTPQASIAQVCSKDLSHLGRQLGCSRSGRTI